MSTRIPIVILASGRGSNFEAIARAVDSEELKCAEIKAVICDRPGAPVLEKAKARGIPAVYVGVPRAKHGETRHELRERHDEAILEAVQPYQPKFLVLAGYMRLLSPRLVSAFDSGRGYSRIINIHPSLLPSFPGIDSYSRAYLHGVHVTGVTVHLVDEHMDSGPICAQESFTVADCRSSEEVEKRGLAIEHVLYPRTLEWVLREEFEITERDGGRTFVHPR